MGKIYMGARHTIAWLGEEVADWGAEDCTKWATFVLYSTRELENAECKRWIESNVALSFDAENPTIEGLCFKSLQIVLDRPWFKRAWVFQEAVLAPELIFLLGRDRYHLEELLRVMTDVIDLQYPSGGYRYSLWKTTKGAENLDSIGELRGRSFRKEKSFLNFLWRARGKWESTEKRDMIFAFLGLLNKPDLFDPLGFDLKADYTIPLGDLFIRLTRIVIEGSKSLDVLGQVDGNDSVSNRNSLTRRHGV
jgi:hypothetical protein